jgi:hypothetical protein
MPPRKKAETAAPAPAPDAPAAAGVSNLSIAQMLQEIAGMLELKGENRF